ncbi:carbohydrate sulfotransferase 10-like [Macrobrachium rosenbergii]|uniref:carbohydrate sulfotransferase 10-like n=1 Tax=Macrobrachium rosenbergii TaxID=79674 RepID=UPI0034D4C901
MTISTTNNNWRGLVRKHLPRKTVCVVISLGLIFFGYASVVSRTEFVTYDVRLQERINGTYDVPLKEELMGQRAVLFNEVHLEIGNSTPPSLLPIRANNRSPYYRDVVVNLSSNWTSERAQSQREVFRRRASVARTGCKFAQGIPGYFEAKNNRLLNNLRWVKKHNLIWCPIFKAASTTWAKNLLLLAGEKVLNKSFHGRVRELYSRPDDPTEEKQVLDSSMKMIIVRHPLDRLLSAYRDKMLRVKHACDPYIKLQKNIIQKYKDPNGDPLPKSNILLHVGLDGTQCLNEALGLNLTVPYGAGNPLIEVQPTNLTFTHPTFSQFLLKVRDDIARFWDKKGNSGLNLHWRPYWITCGPCKLNYDVIAHVETLGPDQEFIIRELGLQNILYNAHAHASNFDSYNDTSNALAHYFRQVPRKILRQIVKYYKPDFEIFGYDHKSFLLLAEGKTNQ